MNPLARSCLELNIKSNDVINKWTVLVQTGSVITTSDIVKVTVGHYIIKVIVGRTLKGLASVCLVTKIANPAQSCQLYSTSVSCTMSQFTF